MNPLRDTPSTITNNVQSATSNSSARLIEIDLGIKSRRCSQLITGDSKKYIKSENTKGTKTGCITYRAPVTAIALSITRHMVAT